MYDLGRVNSILVHGFPKLLVGLDKRSCLPMLSCSVCEKNSMNGFVCKLRDLKTRFPGAKSELDNLIVTLVQTQTVNEELSRWGDQDRVDSADMKEWSKGGCVRICKNFYQDIGNWKCAMLYLLMFRASLGIGEKCSLPFQKLAEKFATLKLDAAYADTDDSLEMMGHCMKCILHTASHTGPIILESVRKDRLSAHQIIKDVNEIFDKLLNFVFDGESYEFVRLPSPSFVIDCLENAFNDAPSESVQSHPYVQNPACDKDKEVIPVMCLQGEMYWRKYLDLQNRPWYWNFASGEWFYAHEGAEKGWFHDRFEGVLTLPVFRWYHKSTGRWFTSS